MRIDLTNTGSLSYPWKWKGKTILIVIILKDNLLHVSCQYTKLNVNLKKLAYDRYVKEFRRKISPYLFSLLFMLGLVVAVIDHEHFRMKLMYKQKKQISADLKTAKNNFKDLQVNIKKAHLSQKNHIILWKGFYPPKVFIL